MSDQESTAATAETTVGNPAADEGNGDSSLPLASPITSSSPIAAAPSHGCAGEVEFNGTAEPLVSSPGTREITGIQNSAEADDGKSAAEAEAVGDVVNLTTSSHDLPRRGEAQIQPAPATAERQRSKQPRLTRSAGAQDRQHEADFLAVHTTILSTKTWGASFRPYPPTNVAARALREPLTQCYYNSRSKASLLPRELPTDFPRLNYTETYGPGDGTRFKAPQQASTQLAMVTPLGTLHCGTGVAGHFERQRQEMISAEIWKKKMSSVSNRYHAGSAGTISDVPTRWPRGAASADTRNTLPRANPSTLVVQPNQAEAASVARHGVSLAHTAPLPGHRVPSRHVAVTLPRSRRAYTTSSAPAAHQPSSYESGRLQRDERQGRIYRNNTSIEDVVSSSRNLLLTSRAGIENVVKKGKVSWSEVPRRLQDALQEASVDESARSGDSTRNHFGSAAAALSQSTARSAASGRSIRAAENMGPGWEASQCAATATAGAHGTTWATSRPISPALTPYVYVSSGGPGEGPESEAVRSTYLAAASRVVSLLDAPGRVVSNLSEPRSRIPDPTLGDEPAYRPAQHGNGAPPLIPAAHGLKMLTVGTSRLPREKVEELEQAVPGLSAPWHEEPSDSAAVQDAVTAAEQALSRSVQRGEKDMDFRSAEVVMELHSNDRALNLARIVEVKNPPSSSSHPRSATPELQHASRESTASAGEAPQLNSLLSSGVPVLSVQPKLLAHLTPHDLFTFERGRGGNSVEARRKNRLTIDQSGAIHLLPRGLETLASSTRGFSATVLLPCATGTGCAVSSNPQLATAADTMSTGDGADAPGSFSLAEKHKAKGAPTMATDSSGYPALSKVSTSSWSATHTGAHGDLAATDAVWSELCLRGDFGTNPSPWETSRLHYAGGTASTGPYHTITTRVWTDIEGSRRGGAQRPCASLPLLASLGNHEVDVSAAMMQGNANTWTAGSSLQVPAASRHSVVRVSEASRRWKSPKRSIAESNNVVKPARLNERPLGEDQWSSRSPSRAAHRVGGVPMSQQLHPNLEEVYTRLLRKLQRRVNYEEMNAPPLAVQFNVEADVAQARHDKQHKRRTRTPSASISVVPCQAASQVGDAAASTDAREPRGADGEGSSLAQVSPDDSHEAEGAADAAPHLSSRRSTVSAAVSFQVDPLTSSLRLDTGMEVARAGAPRLNARPSASSSLSKSWKDPRSQGTAMTLDELEQQEEENLLSRQLCPLTLRLVLEHVEEIVSKKLQLASLGSIKDCLRFVFESRALLDKLLKEAPSFQQFQDNGTATVTNYPLASSSIEPGRRGRTVPQLRLQGLYQKLQKNPAILPTSSYQIDEESGRVLATISTKSVINDYRGFTESVCLSQTGCHRYCDGPHGHRHMSCSATTASKVASESTTIARSGGDASCRSSSEVAATSKPVGTVKIARAGAEVAVRSGGGPRTRSKVEILQPSDLTAAKAELSPGKHIGSTSVNEQSPSEGQPHLSSGASCAGSSPASSAQTPVDEMVEGSTDTSDSGGMFGSFSRRSGGSSRQGSITGAGMLPLESQLLQLPPTYGQSKRLARRQHERNPTLSDRHGMPSHPKAGSGDRGSLAVQSERSHMSGHHVDRILATGGHGGASEGSDSCISTLRGSDDDRGRIPHDRGTFSRGNFLLSASEGRQRIGSPEPRRGIRSGAADTVARSLASCSAVTLLPMLRHGTQRLHQSIQTDLSAAVTVPRSDYDELRARCDQLAAEVASVQRSKQELEWEVERAAVRDREWKRKAIAFLRKTVYHECCVLRSQLSVAQQRETVLLGHIQQLQQQAVEGNAPPVAGSGWAMSAVAPCERNPSTTLSNSTAGALPSTLKHAQLQATSLQRCESQSFATAAAASLVDCGRPAKAGAASAAQPPGSHAVQPTAPGGQFETVDELPTAVLPPSSVSSGRTMSESHCVSSTAVDVHVTPTGTPAANGERGAHPKRTPAIMLVPSRSDGDVSRTMGSTGHTSALASASGSMGNTAIKALGESSSSTRRTTRVQNNSSLLQLPSPVLGGRSTTKTVTPPPSRQGANHSGELDDSRTIAPPGSSLGSLRSPSRGLHCSSSGRRVSSLHRFASSGVGEVVTPGTARSTTVGDWVAPVPLRADITAVHSLLDLVLLALEHDNVFADSSHDLYEADDGDGDGGPGVARWSPLSSPQASTVPPRSTSQPPRACRRPQQANVSERMAAIRCETSASHELEALRKKVQVRDTELREERIQMRNQVAFMLERKNEIIERLKRGNETQRLRKKCLRMVHGVRRDLGAMRRDVTTMLRTFKDEFNTCVGQVSARYANEEGSQLSYEKAVRKAQILSELIQGVRHVLQPMLLPTYARGHHEWLFKSKSHQDPFAFILQLSVDDDVGGFKRSGAAGAGHAVRPHHPTKKTKSSAVVSELRSELGILTDFYFSLHKFVLSAFQAPIAFRPATGKVLRQLCGALVIHRAPASQSRLTTKAIGTGSNDSSGLESLRVVDALQAQQFGAEDVELLRNHYDTEVQICKRLARLQFVWAFHILRQQWVTKRSIDAVITVGLDPSAVTLPAERLINTIAKRIAELNLERSTLKRRRVDNSKGVYKLWSDRKIDIFDGYTAPIVIDKLALKLS